MKIEKIEINRVKVTLSAPDLIDMNINLKSLAPGSPKLHGFLHEIMERVRKETDFNPYNGQVVVEASPEGDGVVLTVTKITDNLKRRPRIRGVRAVQRRGAGKLTYRFDSFEHVCGLFLNSVPDSFFSGALYEYTDSFYMVIQKDASPALAEFCSGYDENSLSESFLTEHGRLLAKGKSLVAMADGVKRME